MNHLTTRNNTASARSTVQLTWMAEFKSYLFHFVTSELLMHLSCSDFFVSRVFFYRNIEYIHEENTTCLDFVIMFMN